MVSVTCTPIVVLPQDRLPHRVDGCACILKWRKVPGSSQLADEYARKLQNWKHENVLTQLQRYRR